MKKLALSLALAVFLFAGVGLAGGIGVASAHGGHYEGNGEEGINTAAGAGAYAPVGSALGIGPGVTSDHPGAVNGILGDNNSAFAGLTHNPLCGANPGYSH